nr:hypothetical protein CFP56_04634 [Quercus suber]
MPEWRCEDERDGMASSRIYYSTVYGVARAVEFGRPILARESRMANGETQRLMSLKKLSGTITGARGENPSPQAAAAPVCSEQKSPEDRNGTVMIRGAMLLLEGKWPKHRFPSTHTWTSTKARSSQSVHTSCTPESMAAELEIPTLLDVSVLCVRLGCGQTTPTSQSNAAQHAVRRVLQAIASANGTTNDILKDRNPTRRRFALTLKLDWRAKLLAGSNDIASQ